MPLKSSTVAPNSVKSPQFANPEIVMVVFATVSKLIAVAPRCCVSIARTWYVPTPTAGGSVKEFGPHAPNCKNDGNDATCAPVFASRSETVTNDSVLKPVPLTLICPPGGTEHGEAVTGGVPQLKVTMVVNDCATAGVALGGPPDASSATTTTNLIRNAIKGRRVICPPLASSPRKAEPSYTCSEFIQASLFGTQPRLSFRTNHSPVLPERLDKHAHAIASTAHHDQARQRPAPRLGEVDLHRPTSYEAPEVGYASHGPHGGVQQLKDAARGKLGYRRRKRRCQHSLGELHRPPDRRRDAFAA